MQRRLEFVGGNSAKFYEVAVHGAEVQITFGRIGTAGQTQNKRFDHPTAAQQHATKVIARKTAKGYVDRTAA